MTFLEASINSDNRKEVSLSWFGKTLWKYTPLYFELAVVAFCLRLIGLVEPFIFQVIIDRILPFQREATLIVVVAIFAGVGLFQMGFSVLSAYLGVLTANRVTKEFGARIYDHVFKLPFSFFRRWNVGEIFARMGETDTIRNFIVGATTGVFLDLIFVTVYIGVLFSLAPLLAWIVVAALPLQALIYFGFGPFLRARLRVQFDAGTAHQAKMVETVTGISAIKALGAERQILDQLSNTLSNSLAAILRVQKLDIGNNQLLFIVEQTLKISIIYFGASLVFAGQLTLGELIAFHLISEKVAGPIANFSSLWESWQNVRISRQRLADILHEDQELFDQLPLLPININNDVRLENIDFSYDGKTPILQDCNFRAGANTLNLITGESGIGKSTFGKLIAQIEAPESGNVFIGGHDIGKYEPKDVRSKIAYIPQEPFLFSGTLGENLSLGREDITDDEMMAALEAMAAIEMVEQLPLGLDTQVGERGSALSGGQRQRVALARSLLVNPSVLVLDEPTSALDEKTQDEFAEQLVKLKKRMTIILITHRPDVFHGVDQVVEFKKEIANAN